MEGMIMKMLNLMTKRTTTKKKKRKRGKKKRPKTIVFKLGSSGLHVPVHLGTIMIMLNHVTNKVRATDSCTDAANCRDELNGEFYCESHLGYQRRNKPVDKQKALIKR